MKKVSWVYRELKAGECFIWTSQFRDNDPSDVELILKTTEGHLYLNTHLLISKAGDHLDVAGVIPVGAELNWCYKESN